MVSRTVHHLARRLGRDGTDRAKSGLPIGGAGLGDDERLPARTLGYLFLAGATIGLVSLLLPLPARAHVGGLYSNVAFAFVAGLALLCGASRMRPWMIHLSLAMGSVVITRAITLSGDAASFYSVWFIWVGLFAFASFARPWRPGTWSSWPCSTR